MSDISRPNSNTNPETPSPSSIALMNATFSIDSLTRQVSDIISRLAKLESQQKPLNSFLRASRRISIISSFALIATPLLLILCVLLAFIILNPTATTSQVIITVFGLVGLAALVEIIAVPIWVKNINDKLNKLIEKYHPSEDF